MAVSDLEALERFVRADAGCVFPCLGVEEMLVQRSSFPRKPKNCPGMILLKAVSPDGELEGRTKFIREPHCRTGFSGRVPDARQPPSASVSEAKYNASPAKMNAIIQKCPLIHLLLKKCIPIGNYWRNFLLMINKRDNLITVTG